MTNYQITIGYKAVITVSIKADSETEAKEKGLKEFKDKFRNPGSNKIEIVDDNFKVDGVLNMSDTWDMIQ